MWDLRRGDSSACTSAQASCLERAMLHGPELAARCIHPGPGPGFWSRRIPARPIPAGKTADGLCRNAEAVSCNLECKHKIASQPSTSGPSVARDWPAHADRGTLGGHAAIQRVSAKPRTPPRSSQPLTVPAGPARFSPFLISFPIYPHFPRKTCTVNQDMYCT